MPDNLNLVPQRGPNVWEKPHASSTGPGFQRQAAVGGVILAAGTVVAFVGGTMLYRAMRHARGRLATESSPALQEREQPDDRVTQESDQSFPASDPPSWTAAGATLDVYPQITRITLR